MMTFFMSLTPFSLYFTSFNPLLQFSGEMHSKDSLFRKSSDGDDN